MQMRLQIDRSTGLPAFRQVQDQIRFLVASGVVPPGVEMSSTRALAAEVGLNPMTVSKAYAGLVREGVLGRRPGRALVVCARPEHELASARRFELEAELRSAAFAAPRLGFTSEEALAVFRGLLEAGPG